MNYYAHFNITKQRKKHLTEDELNIIKQIEDLYKKIKKFMDYICKLPDPKRKQDIIKTIGSDVSEQLINLEIIHFCIINQNLHNNIINNTLESIKNSKLAYSQWCISACNEQRDINRDYSFLSREIDNKTKKLIYLSETNNTEINIKVIILLISANKQIVKTIQRINKDAGTTIMAIYNKYYDSIMTELNNKNYSQLKVEIDSLNNKVMLFASAYGLNSDNYIIGALCDTILTYNNNYIIKCLEELN